MKAKFANVRANFHSRFIYTLAICTCLFYAAVSFGRNPPHTIEHERRAPTPSINEQQALRDSQYRLRQAEREYHRAQIEARKYRGLSPSISSGPYATERLRAENELLRAQQNLRRYESDSYMLQRRYESRQRDRALQSQSRPSDQKYKFQRSYPTIEHERRR